MRCLCESAGTIRYLAGAFRVLSLVPRTFDLETPSCPVASSSPIRITMIVSQVVSAASVFFVRRDSVHSHEKYTRISHYLVVNIHSDPCTKSSSVIVTKERSLSQMRRLNLRRTASTSLCLITSSLMFLRISSPILSQVVLIPLNT